MVWQYHNGTQLLQSFCRLPWTPIFQSIQWSQTWTLPSLHWRLYRRYLLYHQFIPAVNSCHPALKYNWEISDSSLAFLDIKVSIEGKVLCLVCTINPPIPIVICCIHLHIHHMSRLCRLCSESRRTPEQKFTFQIGTLNPHGINKHFSFK